MITILRKIRKQLISKNKFSSYLLYAIGEILLVVVGILIALQINNWNEERKDRHTEHQLLQAIQSNLEEDAENLKISKARYELTLKNIERFFQDILIPDDSLAFISTRMAGHAPFIPNATTFDLSISSGKLDLVRNKELVQQIQRLYAFDYLVIEDSHEELTMKMNKVKNLTEQYEAFDIKVLERKGDFYDQTYVLPWNIENLKRRNQSTALRAIIKHMHLVVVMNLRYYTQLEQKNESLRRKISSYLESS